MNYVSVEELNKKLTENENIQLIDVRETYEYEDHNIGGINVPLIELIENRDKIEPTKTVILCCKSGKRSAAMAITLERKFGLTNIYSLEGGIESYLEVYP